MKALALLLLIFVVVAQTKRMQRNSAYEKFDMTCGKGRTVSGFTALKHRKKKGGSDLRFMIMCRKVDLRGKFKMGDCRDAEEFEFFDSTGKLIADNTFGSKWNCRKGEYLAGIKSAFEKGENGADSVRKFQYHCCKARNAEVDEKVGCNHVGPKNPFENPKRTLFALKNVFFPQKSCPSDVISAVEITTKGVTIKYCPYKVDGVKYHKSCANIKKKIQTYTETDGVGSSSINRFEKTERTEMKTIKEITIVRTEEWTMAGKDFKIECDKQDALQSADFKMIDGDMEMRCKCKEVTEERSETTKTRYTEFVEITQMSERSGCRKEETCAGVVSQKDDNGKRLVALKCVEMSNAVLKEGSEIEEITKEITEETITIESSDKTLQNFYIEVIDEKMIAHFFYAVFEYTESAKFEESGGDYESEWEEMKGSGGSGGTDEDSYYWGDDNGFDFDGGSDSGGSKGQSGSGGTGSEETHQSEFKKIEEIREIRENAYSKERKDFKFECDSDEALKSVYLEMGRSGDIIMKSQCGEVVEDGESDYTRTRYTEFLEVTEMSRESGCSDVETLAGVVSQYDAEKDRRVFSLVCTELSNAECSCRDREIKEVVEEITERGVEIEERSSERVLQNCYMEMRGGKMYAHFFYAEYTYTEDTKFNENEVIDESSGSSSSRGGSGGDGCLCVCGEFCEGGDYKNRGGGGRSGSNGKSGRRGSNGKSGRRGSNGKSGKSGSKEKSGSRKSRKGSRSRSKRETRRWSTRTETRTTRTSSSSVSVRIEELEMRGRMVYVVIPSKDMKLCPKDQCNCSCGADDGPCDEGSGKSKKSRVGRKRGSSK